MFFTNSGTEAIEGAVKIAKKYHFLKHNNHNGEIIAMKKSFHGRSMGRSGNMFAYQLYDVAPDIVVSANALGCGIPVGAIGIRGAATGVLVYCVQEIMAQLTAPILWPLQPLLLYSSFINSRIYSYFIFSK